jgi:hypothetical protein
MEIASVDSWQSLSDRYSDCMAEGNEVALVGAPLLSSKTAQGRFGVAYVQALCAQAGFGHDVTTADEDVRAIDGHVHFNVGSCAYQVKCTTKSFGTKTQSLSWPIEDWWVTRWAQAMMPVYFIVVRVKTQANWVQHPADLNTLLEASAYWTQIDATAKKKSIVVPSGQRLTADILREWAAERYNAFRVAA